MSVEFLHHLIEKNGVGYWWVFWDLTQSWACYLLYDRLNFWSFTHSFFKFTSVSSLQFGSFDVCMIIIILFFFFDLLFLKALVIAWEYFLQSFHVAFTIAAKRVSLTSPSFPMIFSQILTPICIFFHLLQKIVFCFLKETDHFAAIASIVHVNFILFNQKSCKKLPFEHHLSIAYDFSPNNRLFWFLSEEVF